MDPYPFAEARTIRKNGRNSSSIDSLRKKIFMRGSVRKWRYKAVLKEVIIPHFLSARRRTRRRTYKLFMFIVLVRHLNLKYSIHIVWAKRLEPRYIILNAEGMNVSKLSSNNNIEPSQSSTSHTEYECEMVSFPHHYERGDISILPCLSADMTADVLTKPLEVETFERHRFSIMGW